MVEPEQDLLLVPLDHKAVDATRVLKRKNHHYDSKLFTSDEVVDESGENVDCTQKREVPMGMMDSLKHSLAGLAVRSFVTRLRDVIHLS